MFEMTTCTMYVHTMTGVCHTPVRRTSTPKMYYSVNTVYEVRYEAYIHPSTPHFSFICISVMLIYTMLSHTYEHTFAGIRTVGVLK